MKRTMRTNNIKFMAAALCVAISFISCQNDNYADNSNLIYLFPEFQSAQAIQTRGVASGDYSSYTPQSGDKIQAFTYYDEDKESPMYGIRTGAFTYMDGEWKSTVGCEKECTELLTPSAEQYSDTIFANPDLNVPGFPENTRFRRTCKFLFL